jgi:hypothetical protein
MAPRQMHDTKDSVPYLLFLAATIAVVLVIIGWLVLPPKSDRKSARECNIVTLQNRDPKSLPSEDVESDSCPVGSPVRWPPVPPPRRGESITAVDEARRIAANIDKLP